MILDLKFDLNPDWLLKGQEPMFLEKEIPNWQGKFAKEIVVILNFLDDKRKNDLLRFSELLLREQKEENLLKKKKQAG